MPPFIYSSDRIKIAVWTKILNFYFKLKLNYIHVNVRNVLPCTNRKI